MPIDSALRALPQQDRSRASLRRVLDAAREILGQEHSDQLTIAEISKRSGVSVGSIYGRFGGKDDLFLATMNDVMGELDEEWAQLSAGLGRAEPRLARQVPALINALADHLAAHASLLRPFMLKADDPRVAQRGKSSHLKTRHAFEQLLLQCRDQIAHPDPEHAVSACFMIAYATLARFLGLGSAREAAGEGDWKQLKCDLGRMCLGFLGQQYD